MISEFLKGNKLQMTYSVFSSDFCMNRIMIIEQFSINLMDRSFLDGSTQFCENN